MSVIEVRALVFGGFITMPLIEDCKVGDLLSQLLSEYRSQLHSTDPLASVIVDTVKEQEMREFIIRSRERHAQLIRQDATKKVVVDFMHAYAAFPPDSCELIVHTLEDGGSLDRKLDPQEYVLVSSEQRDKALPSGYALKIACNIHVTLKMANGGSRGNYLDLELRSVVAVEADRKKEQEDTTPPVEDDTSDALDRNKLWAASNPLLNVRSGSFVRLSVAGRKLTHQSSSTHINVPASPMSSRSRNGAVPDAASAGLSALQRSVVFGGDDEEGEEASSLAKLAEEREERCLVPRVRFHLVGDDLVSLTRAPLRLASSPKKKKAVAVAARLPGRLAGQTRPGPLVQLKEVDVLRQSSASAGPPDGPLLELGMVVDAPCAELEEHEQLADRQWNQAAEAGVARPDPPREERRKARVQLKTPKRNPQTGLRICLTKEQNPIKEDLVRVEQLTEQAEQDNLAILRQGDVMVKYKAQQAHRRRFEVKDHPDGPILAWRRLTREEEDKEVGAQRLPGNRLDQSAKWWHRKQHNSEALADITGMFYGAQWSEGFHSYLNRVDGSSGKPWLCFTIDFHPSRSIDIVCRDDRQVTTWFVALQREAPLSRYFISYGAVLWQRLIMKLNYYGFDAAIYGLHDPRVQAALVANGADPSY